MNYDESNVLSSGEINTIRHFIDYCKNDELTNNYFEISSLPTGIYYEDINTLSSKQIINLSEKRICKTCNTEEIYCQCSEPEIEKKKFFNFNINMLIKYYLNNISDMYGISVANMSDIDGIIKGTFQNRDNSEINFKFYLKKLTDEFINAIQDRNMIHISLMPIENFDYDANLYEWHEILINDNIDRFKRVFKELFFTEKSNDYYILDLGDDVEISTVETIRDILRKFLINHEFVNITEPIKYKPEVLDYSLPLEKIKECYIKENTKLFVLKPTEKEISLVYFKNGVINGDEAVYKLIKDFDMIIKEKLHSYRKIKNAAEHTNKVEIVILLVTALSNIITGISSIFATNTIFSKINEIIGSNIFIIIYVIINILCVFIIGQNIIVLMRLRYFSWDKKWLKSLIK